MSDLQALILLADHIFTLTPKIPILQGFTHLITVQTKDHRQADGILEAEHPSWSRGENFINRDGDANAIGKP